MIVRNQQTITIIPEGVVGKLYRPMDSSYAIELTHTKSHSNGRVIGRTFVLTCQPYKKQVHKGWDLQQFGQKIILMVQGIDPITGYTYEMMYEPEWIQE